MKVGSGSSPSACSSYCANPNEQAQKRPLEALWLGDPKTIYDAMCRCLICMSLPTPPGPTPTPAVTPAPSLPAVAGEYYVAARPRICDTDPANPTVVSFPLQDEALCQAVARTLGFPIIGPLQRTNLNPRGCYTDAALVKLYFNTGAGGAPTLDDVYPICKRPAPAPPTSAPSATPKATATPTASPTACTCAHGGAPLIPGGAQCSCDCSAALSDLGTTGYTGARCETERCSAKDYALDGAKAIAATAIDLVPSCSPLTQRVRACASMWVRACACVRACVRACMHACACARVLGRVCLHACACARVPVPGPPWRMEGVRATAQPLRPARLLPPSRPSGGRAVTSTGPRLRTHRMQSTQRLRAGAPRCQARQVQ